MKIMIFTIVPFLMSLWMGCGILKAASPEASVLPVLTIQNAEKEHGITLTLEKGETPLAAFMRKDFFWLVFPSAVPLSLKTRKFPSGFSKPEILRAEKGIVVRFKIPTDICPTITTTATGQTQILLNTRPSNTPLPQQTLPLSILKIDLQGTSASLETTERDIVQIQDPLSKKKLFIIPLKETGVGFRASVDKRDFSLCNTLQGLLIEASPSVSLKPAKDSLYISKTGGLNLSPAGDIKFARRKKPSFASHVTAALALKNVDLRQRIAKSTGHARFALEWELIQQQISSEQTTEAIAGLQILAQKNPYFEALQMFQTTKGIALFLKNQLPSAFYVLSNPLLGPETQPWIDATRLKNGETKEALSAIEQHLPILRTFQPSLQAHLLLLASQGAIQAGQDRLALKFLRTIPSNSLNPAQTKYSKDLLKQVVFEPLVPGPPSQTETLELTKPRDWLRREAKVQTVLETILAAYKVGRISSAGALKKLEKIKWESRSPVFESQLLKIMAELYGAENNFLKGLESYARFLHRFKKDPDHPTIEQKAVALYEQAILSSSLPFYSKLAFFRKFKEFLPKTEKRSQIVTYLTKELLQHDLAAEALELMSQELSDPPAADLVFQLADAYLLDNTPKEVFKLFQKYEEGLPETSKERVNLLKAKALEELGQYDEALSLIPDDEAFAHQLARASVLSKKGNWGQAASALERAVNAQKEPAVQLIEHLAVAYYYSGNTEKLTRLLTPQNRARSSFLKIFAQTSVKASPSTLQDVKTILASLNLPNSLPPLKS